MNNASGRPKRSIDFRGFLPHYAAMLNDEQSAYYLLCKNMPVEFDSASKLDNLWKIHEESSKKFQESIKTKEGCLQKRNSSGTITSFLDLKIEIANRMLEDCCFCENSCRINRKDGKTGFCGISDESRISSAFLHYGEESPLVPSGTIFFSGCTFDCVFCQNYDISTIGKKKYGRTSPKGILVHSKKLAEFLYNLKEEGARNINFVGGDPTPNLHTIVSSLRNFSENTCLLWNSNFYNSLSALKILTEIMDLWLPDFKYGNKTCAKIYSGIDNYWDVLTRNLKTIYDWGSRDIIIRHLVMPNHVECCTKPILEWISKNIPEVVVNIMGQYHPEHLVDAKRYSEINRRPSREEMIRAFNLADDLGIEYRLVS